MQIYGTSSLHGAHSLQSPHQTSRTSAGGGASSGITDELSLSPEAQLAGADLVDKARNLPDIRADKVANIRSQIASGVYDSDAKLDSALESLLDEIG